MKAIPHTFMQSFTEMRTAYEFDEDLCEFKVYELRDLTNRQTNRIIHHKADGDSKTK